MSQIDRQRWVIVALCLFLGAAGILRSIRSPDASLFTLSSGFGPAAEALAERGELRTPFDLAVLQIKDGEPPVLVFGAARRPLIPALLAGVALIWNHRALAAAVKAMLLLPFLSLALLALLRRIDADRRWWFVALVALAAAIPSHFSQLTVLEVEEAYIIPLLALLAVSTYLTAIDRRESFPLLGPITAALLLLTKSSLPAVLAVAAGSQWLFTRSRRLAIRYAVAAGGALLLVAVLNDVSSGRFTTASSFDWWNAYKGNNEQTAQFYGAGRLDDLPIESTPPFRDEWAFSDYFREATLTFMRQHPMETMKLAAWKAWNFFGRIDFPSSSLSNQGAGRVAWLFMNAVLRVLMWSAIVLALRDLFQLRRHGLQHARGRLSIAYLGILVAMALPHVAGFAYLRHVMPVVLPTVGFLSLRLFCAAVRGRVHSTPERHSPESVAAA